MKISELLLVTVLICTTSFAATRYPIAKLSDQGQYQVVALSAYGGIVAVNYGASGVRNFIYLFQNITMQGHTLWVSDNKAVVVSLVLTANYLVAGTFDPGSGKEAAYVFVKPANGWQNEIETAVLLPSDQQQAGGFGASVAAYGPTVVVGAPTAGTTMAGAAYVYQEPTSGWANATETAQLTTSDGQSGYDFGSSVAVSGIVGGDGSEIAVGSPQFHSSGAVYAFQEPAGGWTNMTQTAELTNSGGNEGDNLGVRVAMSSGVIASSAPNGALNHVGEVAVFVKPQGGWVDSSAPTALLTDVSGFGIGNSLGITQSGLQVAACCGTTFRNRRVDLAYLFTQPKAGWSNEAKASFKLKLPEPGNYAKNVAITRGLAAVGTRGNSAVTYIFAAQ